MTEALIHQAREVNGASAIASADDSRAHPQVRLKLSQRIDGNELQTDRSPEKPTASSGVDHKKQAL